MELNTNNIITSLVIQFRDLQAFISNPTPTLTNILYLSLLLRLSLSTSAPTPKIPSVTLDLIPVRLQQ